MKNRPRGLRRMLLAALVMFPLLSPTAANATVDEQDDNIDTIGLIDFIIGCGFFSTGEIDTGDSHYLTFSNDAGDVYMIGGGPNNDIIYFPSGG